MNTTGLLFLVIGSVFAALLHITSKKQLDAGWSQKPALFTALTRLIGVFCLLAIAVFTGDRTLQPGWLWPILITGVLNIGIQFADVKAKSLDDVSLVVPISATTPALVVFVSIVMLNEYPSMLGWIGIWVLVMGTYVLNMQGYVGKRKKAGVFTPTDWLAPFLLMWESRGVRFAFLSAGLATFSLNFDALAYRRANVAFASALVFTVVAVANFGIAWRTKELLRKQVPLRLWSLIPIGLLFALAVYCSHSAFRYGITPYVGTLKRLQIPLTIILAYFFVGERINFRERFLGGTMMAIGAILIAIGG